MGRDVINKFMTILSNGPNIRSQAFSRIKSIHSKNDYILLFIQFYI